MIAVSAHAGYIPYVASDQEIARMKSKWKTVVSPSTSKRKISPQCFSAALRRSLSLNQLFAEAFTNTLVRKCFLSGAMLEPLNNGTFSGHRRLGWLDIEYSAVFENGSRRHEKCAVRLVDETGTVLVSWETRDFRLVPFHVTVDETRQVLREIRVCGFHIRDISIAVNNAGKKQFAVSLLRTLGIIKQSLIGVDKYAEFAEMRIEFSNERVFR